MSEAFFCTPGYFRRGQIAFSCYNKASGAFWAQNTENHDQMEASNMNKRSDTLAFPGGKLKALTLSYDDGVRQDRRLVEILNQYGLKCTFNLSSGLFGLEETGVSSDPNVDVSKLSQQEALALYAGHEIAGHGLRHANLTGLGTPAAMYEIVEDKRRLEQLAGQPLRSFAYPYGAYSEEVQQLLRLAGYQSARTVVSTGGFDLPGDLLAWNPTCHHRDPRLMELARAFCEEKPRFFRPQLFYLWGHAYEFDQHDNWQIMEQFAQYVARFAGDIWFASNGDISDYLLAWNRLQYSADGRLIRNSSALPLWLHADGRLHVIQPGQTLAL